MEGTWFNSIMQNEWAGGFGALEVGGGGREFGLGFGNVREKGSRDECERTGRRR